MANRAMISALQKRLRSLEEERASVLRAFDEERASIISLLEIHGAATRAVRTRRTKRRRDSLGADGPVTMRHGGPTASIFKVLAGAPDGLTFGELVERAARIVRTRGTDPRAVIAACIHNLKTRGRIVQIGDVYDLPGDSSQ